MAQGKVAVYNENLGQGEFPEIERQFLFIGVGALDSTRNQVHALNNQSNLDALFGAADSALKTNLLAARQNAGQNWQAWAYSVSNLFSPVIANFPPPGTSDPDPDAGDGAESKPGAAYFAALQHALETCSPECVVVVDQDFTRANISEWHTQLMDIRGTHGRFIWGLLAADGINSDNQSWAEYLAAMESVTDDVAANTICVVPQLHGNDVGVLAGRLCNRQVSIADTPMRVATGSVLGLGDTPVDKKQVPLPAAILTALDGIRYSCIQTYPDYPGTYWGDANILDTPIGDYKVAEHLRVMLKAMRAVRLLAIERIGDRLLNSTPASIAAHKQYFTRPLREMAQSIAFAGYVFPGEIEPPGKDAITIQWMSKTRVKIYLQITPHNCPKQIDAHLILDLSHEEAA